jgi:CheY-like chemotaxis protein
MPEIRKLVLVVDEVAANRHAVSRVLQSANYATVEAATGREAIDQPLRVHPDAIVLDMNMPEQDGLVTLQQLRDNDPDPQPYQSYSSAQPLRHLLMAVAPKPWAHRDICLVRCMLILSFPSLGALLNAAFRRV